MNEVYRPIVEGLSERSVETYFQGDDQLVVSRQYGPVLPYGGNSFWVTNQEGIWYICTWSPTCYKVPEEADLVGLCVDFVDFGSGAQGKIPASMAERYGLTRLTDAEAAETFEW